MLTSSYLQHLPAIFSDDQFLGQFLLAFEQVLTGLPNSQQYDPNHGLEEKITALPKLFDPSSKLLNPDVERMFFTPAQKKPLEDFLQWLAGWVALTLHEDWGLDRQRALIAEIVPLYQHRGTKRGLEKLLSIYTSGLPVSITDDSNQPFYFRVTITFSSSQEELEHQRQIVSTLIDLQKPAYTYYDLEIQLTGTIQVEVNSYVESFEGKEMVLGDIPLETQ